MSLNLSIIIASNIPIGEMVQRGEFRADLFFRINAVNIQLPSLNQRLDDIPELCEYFIQLYAKHYGKPVRGLTSKAFQKLYVHHWPGNVRELRNVINRAFIFCEGEDITEELLELHQGTPYNVVSTTTIPPNPRAKSGPQKQPLLLSREQMVALLKENQGKVFSISEKLGTTRQAIYYYLRKYSLELKEFRTGSR